MGLKFTRTGLKMNTEYSVLPSPRKSGSQEEIDKAGALPKKQAITICSNSSLAGIPPVDLESQLQLIDQVMSDRSIHCRPGPRRKALQELGLPDDADIPTLMNHWRYRKTQEFYVNERPSDWNRG